MKFTKAIVKTPCKALVNGITDHPELGVPDYEKALAQHAAYIKALQQCGVEVTVLPADENYPDSCFVEDTAVLCPECAVLTNPGAETRNGEAALMLPTLQLFYADDQIFRITAPGTLEGGDVMLAGKTFYVGLSARTNAAGVAQLAGFVEPFGYKVVGVTLTEVLHLKTGVNYLENGTLLAAGEFVTKPVFEGYEKILVPADEAYASNCVWMNDNVLVPEGYPQMLAKIEQTGYTPVVCDTSEFKKVDGGLSCLSLRF